MFIGGKCLRACLYVYVFSYSFVNWAFEKRQCTQACHIKVWPCLGSASNMRKTKDKVFKIQASKCEIHTYTLHVWRSCSVPFAFVDISLPCLVPSPDLLKCAVQMEADSVPFCSGWIAYEYLLHCHRGFDGHLRCVKTEKGLCQMLGLYSVTGYQLRSS